VTVTLATRTILVPNVSIINNWLNCFVFTWCEILNWL
jgi:hypothetical protein